VPRVRRTADATWEGNVARGSGTISGQSGAFGDVPYSLPSRIRATDGSTSPEELLAAAHAGCFAMSLATELANAGVHLRHLEVRATVTLDEVDGAGHQIVASELHARAQADLDRETFRNLAEAADQGCTFSTLLRASAEVTLDADLEEG
jgi:osmotically inducible protein OsmC